MAFPETAAEMQAMRESLDDTGSYQNRDIHANYSTLEKAFLCPVLALVTLLHKIIIKTVTNGVRIFQRNCSTVTLYM